MNEMILFIELVLIGLYSFWAENDIRSNWKHLTFICLILPLVTFLITLTPMVAFGSESFWDIFRSELVTMLVAIIAGHVVGIIAAWGRLYVRNISKYYSS